MSASKQVQMHLMLSVKTSLSGSFVNSNDNHVTEDGLTVDKTGTNALTGSTTPAVSKSAFTAKALSSGSATLDLTAMPNDSDGTTVNFNGLKPVIVIFNNPITNANKITITKGGTNGLGLNAAGDSWTAVLDPGDTVERYITSGTTVGSGVKTWDITGTGSQVLNIGVVGG